MCCILVSVETLVDDFAHFKQIDKLCFDAASLTLLLLILRQRDKAGFLLGLQGSLLILQLLLRHQSELTKLQLESLSPLLLVFTTST